MLRHNYILFSMGLLTISLCLGSSRDIRKTEPVCFHILQGSQLYLEGNTNIHSFICNCDEVDAFPPLNLEMEIESSASQIYFDKAQLKIKTQNLDCGHRIMNKDLHECLRATDHPYISVDLKTARLLADVPKISKEYWTLVAGRARLTVAGVSKTVYLKATARKLKGNTYRFISKHTINMTDYNIVPPSAFMGTIKVHDQITINFDLLIAVE